MISLLKDQVKTLKEHNIKAYGIYEGMGKSEGNAMLFLFKCLYNKLIQINQYYFKILLFDILMS